MDVFVNILERLYVLLVLVGAFGGAFVFTEDGGPADRIGGFCLGALLTAVVLPMFFFLVVAVVAALAFVFGFLH